MYRVICFVPDVDMFGRERETEEVLAVAFTLGWARVVASRLAEDLGVYTEVRR